MPRVIHFEIHASEPAALMDFYGQLFGWKFSKWGTVDYWLVETGPAEKPGINGGLLPRRGPAPVGNTPMCSFACTVEVESLDDSLAKGIALGGSVAVGRMPITSVVWLAYLKDPDGNIFGIMQPDAKAA